MKEGLERVGKVQRKREREVRGESGWRGWREREVRGESGWRGWREGSEG